MTPAECLVVGEVDLYPGASLQMRFKFWAGILGYPQTVKWDVGLESYIIDIRCGAGAA